MAGPAADAAAARTLFGYLGIGFLCVIELVLMVAMPLVGILVAAIAGLLFAVSQWQRSKDPEWLYQDKVNEVIQYFSAGNWDAALEAVEECDGIEPGEPETLGLKGQILFQLQRFEEAIPCLQAGQTIEAEILMLAEALRHTGRYRQSLEVLKAPPLNEELALKALVIRAANHVELDEADTAIDILKTAPLKKRNLDDTLKEVHWVMAKAYEKAGKRADSVKHLRRVYAADPSFMDVATELERMTKAAGA